jgi:hypothetical protein
VLTEIKLVAPNTYDLIRVLQEKTPKVTDKPGIPMALCAGLAYYICFQSNNRKIERMFKRVSITTALSIMLVGFVIMIVAAPAQMNMRKSAGPATPEPRNSWRGVIPLKSSGDDVIRLVHPAGHDQDPMPIGPFRVDGGEVTFSYVTASLADIYRAPKSMVGKVFTVYFKPDPPLRQADPEVVRGLKRCVDAMDKRYYYYLSLDGGLAYQVRNTTNDIEMLIYQPLHAEVQRLRVNTTCVF